MGGACLETVGSKIGGELRGKALQSVLFALLGILIYISLRFDRYYAVGAVAALAHDVLITLGVFSLLNLELDLAIIGAFLTIVGYSLNDTIVVFDRIRENVKIFRKGDFVNTVNRSINEPISGPSEWCSGRCSPVASSSRARPCLTWWRRS